MLFIDIQLISYLFICVTNCAGVDRRSILTCKRNHCRSW
nr:MAG TPA: DNA-binding domain protain [Caudoviricetes sp.]